MLMLQERDLGGADGNLLRIFEDCQAKSYLKKNELCRVR